MSKGVKWPFEATGRGGLKQSSDNIKGLLALALLPRHSSNPFNERDGIGSADWTWTAVTPHSTAMMKQRVERVFSRFQRAGRARLVGVEVHAPGAHADDGQVLVEVVWVDLGTGMSDTTTVSVGDV